MPIAVLGFLIMGGALAPPLDELTLVGGRVMLGHVEKEEPGHVVFREIRSGGRITAVQIVERDQIVQLRHDVLPVAAPHAADPPAPPESRVRQLAEIVDHWRDRDLQAAAAALLPLTRSLSAREMGTLDAVCQAQLGRSLARFAAEIQIGCSLELARHGTFRLAYVTHFNAAEVHALLTETLDRMLGEPLTCQALDSDQPHCDRRDRITNWLDHGDTYTASATCARHLTRHVAHALGMSREIQRLSRALHLSPELRQAEVEQHTRLRQLFVALQRHRTRRDAPVESGPAKP